MTLLQVMHVFWCVCVCVCVCAVSYTHLTLPTRFAVYISVVAVSLKKYFFKAEDGIRDSRMSRGLGDMYKRQVCVCVCEYACEYVSACVGYR